MTNATEPEPHCKVGDRIELIAMPDDPHPIEVGAKGTVESIVKLAPQEQWQIWVHWDNGRALSLIHPVDQYKVIHDRD